MNSTPLSAPDGLTYAYACGECKRVYVGYGAALTDRVADSRVLATKCCLCLDCKAALSEHYKGSPSAICTPCHQKRRDAEVAAQLKRVEKALDPEAALELLEEMESYCCNNYCSQWLEDIEFNLLSSADTAAQKRFNSLRTAAGGWWTRQDGDDEPRFVTTAEWLEILTATQRRDGETT